MDYQAHSPVHAHLADRFSGSRFNAAIDAVGIQGLAENCAGFVVEGGLYISVGPRLPSYTYVGMLTSIWLMAKAHLWPSILGGIPRKYVQVNAVADLKSMERLASMVTENKLRVVPDLVEGIGKVPEVSCILPSYVCFNLWIGVRKDARWACERQDSGEDCLKCIFENTIQ